MSFLVVCTFDLKNADYSDYQDAYKDLATIGLYRTIVSDKGKSVVAPTTMTMGTWNGESAAVVRDTVCNQVQKLFRARRFTSEIFVVVGSNWAWGGRTT